VAEDPEKVPVPLSVPSDWPEEVKFIRLQHWTPVTVVIGLFTGPPATDGGRPDLLATKPILLPRAPVRGERFEFCKAYGTVSNVSWRASGHCTVRLSNGLSTTEFLTELEADGWNVTSAEDADDAFRSLLG
jgi:hypothetical protein